MLLEHIQASLCHAKYEILPDDGSDLIRHLKQLGFEGPYSGGTHQLMAGGEITNRVPNPPKGDIGMELLSRIPR